jgi:hypothetical protein
MAFRYLIYSTGTTFAETIVRESATDNPNVNEASLFSDFVIPEIQPLYLWRVTGGTDVVPNTDANINAYLESIAPPPEPQDDATVGYVTGITSTKIDKVTGATGNLGEFNAEGNLVDTGYAVSDLTGGTQYNFTGSGATQVTTGSTTGGTVQIIIYSTPPTGSTVAWGDITGTLSNQTDLQNALDTKLDITDFNSYTGTTETALNNKLETSAFNSYTGTTQPIIDSALTGVTNLGTGTTLGDTSGRNITLKSISVLGGLQISGDADNLIISGETNASINWGDIGGTLSDQTDLQNALDTKLDETVFNNFTGTTLPTNYYNKTEINSYTGTTDTRLNGIENDIDELSGVTEVALTGATNGLTTNGRVVELGAALTRNTVISGTTFDFTLNPQSITLQAPNGIDIIDTDGNGVNIESDAGTVSLIGNTNLGIETTKLEISETVMRITDSRGTPTGVIYAGDYSTSFVPESLVTKRYVDNVASGLIPKASVDVATTTNIDLSGATFGGVIDGYSVANGDRVLVKDQTDASQNGIYDYVSSANTFTRSTDFDGTPDGEVVDGNIIPVISGDTQYNTIWILVTPNPIIIDTTLLDFTLFSRPHELIAGTGISISGNEISVDGASLAGNSISWTGNTFNVDTTSGTLGTALTDIENDIQYLSGQTDTKLDTSVFTGYTATTDTRLEGIEDDITGLTATTATKLDTSVFTGYTASTASNELFLIHTGDTEVNTVAATAIEWDDVIVSGSSYSWTGGSDIFIQETAEYEISYSIPYSSQETRKNIGVAANIILNNNTVLDNTSAGALSLDLSSTVGITLPTVILSLSSGDKLTLAAFRTAAAGSGLTEPNASILIKKKSTLQ